MSLERPGHYWSALNCIFDRMKWEEGAQCDFGYPDEIFAAGSD